MGGRIPVMTNYSTIAEFNARYAQKKCRLLTIITSKAYPGPGDQQLAIFDSGIKRRSTSR
ncbi:MAG: hypothetical protein GY697_00285 [Desulfobacterales bacterium]|nr:hypothetical protein [Desulfobacterales bacterium]